MTITVKSENPILIDEYAFSGVWDIETNCKLRVPVGSKDAYLNAIGWNRFLSDNVTEYGSDVIIGDANGDGKVNVNDVVTTVNHILEKENTLFVFEAADVNEDNEIDVTDVVGIVNIILGKTKTAGARQMARPLAGDNDRLHLADNGNASLSVCLDNQSEYVAAQFDLRLAEGQTLKAIRLNSSRKNGHQVAYAKVGDNYYRVLAYAIGNQSFNGQQGELVSIETSGNSAQVTVENILFTTKQMTTIKFAPLQSTVTGIEVISQMSASDIYTVDGRLVRKQATSTEGLEKGIHIINHKKVIVK